MRVPILDLPAQYREIGPELDAAIKRVMESGYFVNGPEVERFERSLAELHGAKHAIGCTSGSDALLMALMALDLPPGSEVVTTAFSFFATAGAIARLGLRPVFADVDPATMNLDPKDALRRITSKTSAIIPVHLFGRAVDLEPLLATGLPVIEDAAQAVAGPAVGRHGRVATYSFFPSKNLGAAGDAGALTTNDDALAERLRVLRAHGSKKQYVHDLVGGNFRLDALQAAILSAKLPHLAEWNQRRRRHMGFYREALADTPLVLPADAPGHVWHHFVVRTPRREELKQFLGERGVDSAVYYPIPLHRQPCFGYLNNPEGSLPVAEQLAREVLALPVHPDLSPAQLEHVAASVHEFFR